MFNQQIAHGNRVTVRCRVTENSGTVLDDGSKPLSFVFGRQQVISALEAALLGQEAGFHTRIAVAPEQAYGLHRPELVFEAVRENLPPGLNIQPGMELSPGGSEGKFNLKVVALTERGAMLDGNHRFAGKHLVFDMEVLNVEPVPEASHV
jgi:FKBP-type peptidyl-prolyl cis-trans isomerase SlyD